MPTQEISIHALLAESDKDIYIIWECMSNFYPRSPCGERPQRLQSSQRHHPISIHALLAESDGRHATAAGYHSHFYPRSPCGERRAGCVQRYGDGNFYPRSPCGERRIATKYSWGGFSISIHALLAESDALGVHDGWRYRHFYPRSPCGERRPAGTKVLR